MIYHLAYFRVDDTVLQIGNNLYTIPDCITAESKTAFIDHFTIADRIRVSYDLLKRPTLIGGVGLNNIPGLEFIHIPHNLPFNKVKLQLLILNSKLWLNQWSHKLFLDEGDINCVRVNIGSEVNYTIIFIMSR